MSQSVCILGRQPALGLAELESLYGSDNVTKIGETAALVDMTPDTVAFSRLGGTVKLAKLLTKLDTDDWAAIERYLKETIPQHLSYVPEGKLKLGLSLYGFSLSTSRINNIGLQLKKTIKATGRSVRVIPNKQSDLNTAQVIHNQLVGPNGWELLFIKDGNKTVLAQTVAVQDIDAYAARDQARPKRDARVGMLPPKLAQIIINLAAGQAEPSTSGTLLDPFCGTGVILQEAALMGFDIYGSDLDERMVDYTHDNLVWLGNQNWSGLDLGSEADIMCHLDVADATDFNWKPTHNFIACETYLGRPFSAAPKPDTLNEVMSDVDTIHRKFLRNVARQTPAGFRMCIAVPAWKTSESSSRGFKHLKTLDSLEELGYTRMSFELAPNQDLIYHRENQIVGRELVVLIRK